MLLKEYVDGFLSYSKAKGKSNKTIHEYRRFLDGIIIPVLGDRDIHSLRKTDTALLESAGREHGENGSQRTICYFRRLLNYIEDSGDYLPFNWRDIQLPRVPSSPVYALTKEEVELIRQHWPFNTLADYRERAVIELLLDSGMRIGELVSINKSDVDWVNKKIEIVNCKTHEKQNVYFTDNAIYWLNIYLSKRKDDLESLFVSGRGRLLEVTSRNYLTHISKLMGTFGLKKRIHHHLFRKTFTTKLLRNGVNIKAVQILARHRSERTTLKHYVAITKDQAEGEYRRVMGGIMAFFFLSHDWWSSFS